MRLGRLTGVLALAGDRVHDYLTRVALRMCSGQALRATHLARAKSSSSCRMGRA
jgi:hypothetical protein